MQSDCVHIDYVQSSFMEKPQSRCCQSKAHLTGRLVGVVAQQACAQSPENTPLLNSRVEQQHCLKHFCANELPPAAFLHHWQSDWIVSRPAPGQASRNVAEAACMQ